MNRNCASCFEEYWEHWTIEEHGYVPQLPLCQTCEHARTPQLYEGGVFIGPVGHGPILLEKGLIRERKVDWKDEGF